MNTHLFATPTEVIAGLIVGLFFGFLLQRAGVTRFSTIVGQLLLKDFTVMKVIMTAIAFGSLGLYTIKSIFLDVDPVISTTTLFAALTGGGIFGVGMAVLGFCPGTCVGALAEKAKDAWFGLAGMILGAGLYAEIFPWVTQQFKPASEINKTTLAHYFNVSPWIFIGSACLVVAFLVFTDNRAKRLAKTRNAAC